MSPAAITPVSPPSPTLDTAAKLAAAGASAVISSTLNNSAPQISDLSPERLTITRNAKPKAVPAPDSAEVWAQTCTTDHMLTARWTEEHGWAAPAIEPYGALSIMPTASVLHYATSCFEGLKAYRGSDGRVRLFRPQRNAARLVQSAARVALPPPPPAAFLTLLKRFVGFESAKWIPNPGDMIYLRPTLVATAAALGVQRPREALLCVIMMPFPALDEPRPAKLLPSLSSATAKPAPGMRLLASMEDTVRAWPGGFGFAKVGANYGPSLVAQGEARRRGYDQVLWLFGPECWVTEAGGSNFFVLWETPAGRRELVTAPLDDGVILEGVTRASVLDLVRAHGHAEYSDVSVVERRYTMDEIVAADREGRLIEAFGAGTAFFISPVADIHFRGVDIVLPLGRGRPADFALGVKERLKDVMYGRVQHEWGVVVDEEQ